LERERARGFGASAVTVTAGNVVPRSASGAELCALAHRGSTAPNKAMDATVTAKAFRLECVGRALTVAARIATGRQLTRDDIAPASDFMNMNDGATCRGQRYRVNESSLWFQQFIMR
jgi:hypothetical protein